MSGSPETTQEQCREPVATGCSSRQRCVQIRWLIAGAVFGALFPLIGWLAATATADGAGLGAAHRSQPVLYIVDLAPFVLGMTGYAIGQFHARLIKIRHSIEHTVQTRTTELQQALNELSTTQAELLNAQKLEAIGGLAAGIAHEINTPIQYVSDNTRFVEESLSELLEVASAASHLADAVRDVSEVAGLVEAYNEVAGQADIEFLSEEIPGALEESLEGIDQVAAIVKALKSFAHPGSEDRAEEDLNEIIRTTVAVARNEWKYVAEMDLGDLDANVPKVPILSGPLKQVLLNMIVNAAQAIEDVVGTSGEKGTIYISTRVEGDHAVVDVRDTGTGIPEEIQDRILEPFFTTKDVGRGSGQGLAIAQSIVDKHGGKLLIASVPGHGATFTIKLPMTNTLAVAGA